MTGLGLFVPVFLLGGGAREGAPPGFCLLCPLQGALLPTQPGLSFPSPPRQPNCRLCSASTTVLCFKPGGLFSPVLPAVEILNSHTSFSDHNCQSSILLIFSALKQSHETPETSSSWPFPPLSPGPFQHFCLLVHPYVPWTRCVVRHHPQPPRLLDFLRPLKPLALYPPTLHLLCLRASGAEYH